MYGQISLNYKDPYPFTYLRDRQQKTENLLHSGSLPKRPQHVRLGQMKPRASDSIQVSQGVARTQVCEPSCVAFLDMLIGSWIRKREARIGTGTLLWDASVASSGLTYHSTMPPPSFYFTKVRSLQVEGLKFLLIVKLCYFRIIIETWYLWMPTRMDLGVAVCREMVKNVRHVSKHIQLIHVNLGKQQKHCLSYK